MSNRLNPATNNNGSTRRQAIIGAALVASGIALRPAKAWADANDEVSRTAESIHQEPVFKASRAQIYKALTDTNQFDKVIQLSGAMKANPSLGTRPTAITREVGGPFVIFGGYITGLQIELVPDERIVQAWRVGSWPPGVYSIAKFDLVEQSSSTKIVFDHTGFPTGDGEHLAQGWRAHYWEPLEKLLT
ncbi:activator of Hsp90 ATPase-like protein [Edaphobacter aggregans]|uniref:Activator of Hsp90 ATPase-like protein n=1 Tax=Edaphobacter aggregans TaxID=570835 RepID=A0A428ME53_9BACT|nr:SRPBCC family protein [Edaphobacter aggregans]RSL15155.1 activator of Hsp90 ATPase-like protein [Edaphobacter aggregans]